MNQEILNIFYKELVQETTSNDQVKIGDWSFNVNFSISTNNIENKKNDIVIDIKDENKFNEALINYTNTMIDHINKNPKLQEIEYIYFDGLTHDMIKAALLNVWYNATEEDFKNPIDYLKLRTNFLNDEISQSNSNKIYTSKEIPLLKNLSIENSISIENPSAHETPFIFKSKIKDNTGNCYNLPNICYGISDNTCYIYSIQKEKQKEETSFSKQVNRLLYRANKDLNYDYDDENIKDVSVSQLFSITSFFKFLEENNISKIVIKNYLPIRYEAKKNYIDKKVTKLKEKIETLDNPDEELINTINNLLEENDKLHMNIINKYLRIFRRLEHTFSNITITSYPYELDNNMHIELSKYQDYNKNHILNEVYESETFTGNNKHK